MVDFPTNVVNFLQLQDGIDKIIAAHPNDRGNEITAIETLMGSLGSSQAYSESFKNLLYKYRRGCLAEYKGAADLYVRTGEIMITNGSTGVRLRRNTADITVDWTMLDTGVEAISTTYYVYALADTSGTTFTIKLSASSSLPSGATYYRKLGSFYNDASGNIDISTFTEVAGDPVIIGNSGAGIAVYDYGTSLTTAVLKTERQLKFAMGYINAIAGNSSVSVTNLPFSTATSYVVVTCTADSGAYNEMTSLVRDSGAQFTATNNHVDNIGGNGNVLWFAVGY